MSRQLKIGIDVFEGFVGACLLIAIVGRVFFRDSVLVDLAVSFALGASISHLFMLRYFRNRNEEHWRARFASAGALESMSRVIAVLTKRLSPQGHVDIAREELESDESSEAMVFVDDEGVRILVR